jgi:hypothetical protein
MQKPPLLQSASIRQGLPMAPVTCSQSSSLLKVQPLGQQPSLLMQLTMGVEVHRAVH